MKRLLFCLYFIFSISTFAANRYWVGPTALNWNDPTNWSVSSGGVGGASVPGAADIAIFDANGNGDCNLDISPTLGGILLDGYTGVIDLDGNTLLVSSGNTLFRTGTINDTPNTGSLTINSAGQSRFNGTTFGAEVLCESGRLLLDGSTFNNTANFTKTGANSDVGRGGNVFNGTTLLSNTGSNYLMTGNVNFDIFNGELTISNTSTSRIYLANNTAGNEFNDNILVESTGSSQGVVFCQNATASATLALGKTISTTGGGYTAGDLRISRFTQLGTTAQSLTTTGVSRIYLDNSTWNGDVNFTGSRIYTRNSAFNGVTTLTKTGAIDDYLPGGNTFDKDVTLNNSSPSYFLMGGGSPDIFNEDVVINNSGSNVVYFADNSVGNSVVGNLTVNQTASGDGIRIGRTTGTTLTIGGNLVLNLSGNENHSDNIADAGTVTIGGDFTIENTSSAASTYVYVANQVAGSVVVDGNTSFINNATGLTTHSFRIAENGAITFNGQLNVENNSAATNSTMQFNRGLTGVSNFNEDVIIESTAPGSDGISFGESGGAGILAASKTITIGPGGYVSGLMYLRNFTQIGATPQSLTLTGTARLIIYDSDWGGDVTIVSPRLTTRGTTYNGTVYLEKTAGDDDNSQGGNTFTANTTLIHSGANRFAMGNGAADIFQGDLLVNNQGSGRFELAMNSAGNNVLGDLTINNTGSAALIVLSSDDVSTLNVVGETVINNSSTAASSQIYVSNNGASTFQGPFTYNNTSSSANLNSYFAHTISSSCTFNDDAAFYNLGTGATTQRMYLGNRGDITFNGELTLINTSGATNSEIQCNYEDESVGIYNGNIIIENSNASGDGIRFGQSGGVGTLASGKTVTIAAGGFIAGELRFDNFTQVGSTNQVLSCTGTTIFRNIDSNWGGNVEFDAPRFITSGTMYNGTALIEKTGGIGDDQSAGGNTFVGDLTLRNSGSRYVLMGNVNPDVCQGNLILDNASSSAIYWAHNSIGNVVLGNLDVSLSLTANRIEFARSVDSDLEVNGNMTIVNNSAGASNIVYIGNSGDVTVNGDFSYSDNTTGATTHLTIANAADASFVVNGNTLINQNGTGATDAQYYIGYHGDITFDGTLIVNNNSPANYNQIYFNLYSASEGIYNDNITLTASQTNSDGIRFGQNGGAGTLAATKTVSIGGAGYIAGDLQFRNFTQVGPTAQSIAGTGTTRFYNYDSDWGGDVTFSAPRMLTRGTIYRGTSYIEKNGASGDYSYGGNTFVGNAELVNSGVSEITFGNNLPDVWQGDLAVNNTGSSSIIIARNSLGNSILGDLTWNLSGASSQNDVLANYDASDITIEGAASFNNSSSNGGDIFIGYAGDVTINSTLDVLMNTTGASNSTIQVGVSTSSTISVLGEVNVQNTSTSDVADVYIASGGTVTFHDNLIANNAPSGLRGRMAFASNTSSSFQVDGTAQITNNSTSPNDGRVYFGNNGDITCNGVLTLVNNSGVSLSHFHVNLSSASTGLFNDNIVMSCTNATSDGIRFGEYGGNGTLAATKTITIDAGGFISGDLRFRNFTQVGPTNQTLIATGTTRMYHYNSDWGGDVTFASPRFSTRGTVYNGSSYLEKTGTSGDQSYGDNIFVGDAELVNSGSSYFQMGNSNSDEWQSDLLVRNTGSDYFYLGYSSAGNTIAGTLDLENTGAAKGAYLATGTGSTIVVSGASTFLNTSTANSSVYVGYNGAVTFESTVDATNSAISSGSGQIRFAERNASSVLIEGATNFVNNSSSVTSTFVAGNLGDIQFNSTLDMVNAGSGTSSYFYLGNYASSTVIVNGDATFNQSGAISNTTAYLGNSSINTYNGDLSIINSSTSTNSEVYLNRSTTAVSSFNGDITVTSENTATDGVRFGQDGGSATLADGKTISVGAGGFVAGDLRFRNFTQLGGAAQNVVCTGTARVYHHNSLWNAQTVFEAASIYTRETIYEDNTALTKTGAATDYSAGGNVFNGTTTVTNSGTGHFRMSWNAGLSNDFNDDVTWIKTGTGALQPTYNNIDTYAGDFNVNSNAQIYFGLGGNGRVLLDGASGDQNFNDLGTSGITLIRDLQVNKASGNVNLETPVEVTVELDLDNGIVNTSPTGVLYMRDNSNVSSVSDVSHVDGPIEKIGNDAFVFPVGDNSLYRPISMSNPSSGAARFRAEYFNADPHPTYNQYSKNPSIDHISSCEYWTLDRMASSSNVVVTLSWETPTSCGVDDIGGLTVARWDGSVWQDHGSGTLTGTTTAGTISTLGTVTSFSPFTLASVIGGNPLPIELVSFDAKLNSNEVDLEWITASEIDNDYFTIERSRDGENFEYLTQVEGAGTSSETLNYQSIDRNPYTGVNYYRLKQTDFNGDFEYSEIRSVYVTTGDLENIIAYPNPTNDVVYVVGSESVLEGIEVFNAVGQLILPSTKVSDGQVMIDLSDFENGIYFVKTKSDIIRIAKQ